jgi:hypothetical protein
LENTEGKITELAIFSVVTETIVHKIQQSVSYVRMPEAE